MDTLDALQSYISSQAFAGEQQCVESLLSQLENLPTMRPQILAHATKLVTRIRETGNIQGIGAFLHTYGLETREGVAVMCLAEALLRIPDQATANRLIHDKLEGTEWSQYLGRSDSFFVNASGWGMLLAGKLEHWGEIKQENPATLLGKLVSRAGEPVIREALKQAMRFLGSQFVLGETIEEALKKSAALEQQGYRFSYDMLGEGARTMDQAKGYIAAYRHTIAAIGRHHKSPNLMDAPGISIKLSALHPRYQHVNETRVMEELLPSLTFLVECAMNAGLSVSIDAEEAVRLDIELKLFRTLFCDPVFKTYEGIGFVLQAYQKRAVHVIDYLAELSRVTSKRMMLRLVKGAYWDSEIKNAQVLGLPSYPVFTCKEHTDISYLACTQKILANSDCFYPQFATHNALSAASILEMASKNHTFEFQRLHGMGEPLHDQLLQHKPCRIYAPIGRHEDLLAYLIRRLLENGANTSFINALTDKEEPLATLLADPIETARKRCYMQNDAIPNPARLYPDHPNSEGYDLGNAQMLGELIAKVSEFGDCFWQTTPSPSPAGTAIVEPANNKRIAGYAEESALQEIEHAITAAHAAFAAWQRIPVEERSHKIGTFARLLQENQYEALALLMREAGKTLPDAIAELREAIDYCHYYSAQARKLLNHRQLLKGPTGEHNTLLLAPRGVFACISPWNFPLAIFTGQIIAALATGNTVIAKPAAQTPLIAAFAVRLLHKAGIPGNALHLLIGSGETVGSALTKDERLAGAVFTGSMQTARHINRALAAREGSIGVLIAETGGQNCMIVDSSALLEQVTDDVIASAFGSAGQRCSALRVLYAQEEIADRLIALITGAMQELKTGDPFGDPSVDIGPVIDERAKSALSAHIEKMKTAAKLLATAPLSQETAKNGTFIAPHLFEIRSIKELEHEVFGPVLHVIRYHSGELEHIFDEINSTGYGLTFGLESRIEQTMSLAKERIHAGNLYINRSMIGATVGVQPFGGEGLSGTGPKAGGPHYLLRFVTERTHSINTAAIGGNIELLSKQR